MDAIELCVTSKSDEGFDGKLSVPHGLVPYDFNLDRERWENLIRS